MQGLIRRFGSTWICGSRAIDKVNQKLQLNVDLGVDVQFGYRYSDIH